jgi:hypothetical protein
MSLLVSAEKVSLLAAKETTLGTQPTTGWQTLQPNQGGIDGFYPAIKTVAPSPLSKFRQLERPEIVDLDAMPIITSDLTKDLIDVFGEGMFLAAAKHPGGTGLSYFLPTARTSTDYTVPALGALQANTLVYARGFVNTANNGLFAVGASSTGTAVKVASGVAETVSGYVATLEVAGFRGASGDIGMNASGNLTATTADFTTMGLFVGMVIWVGGTVGGGHDFATAAYRGYAKITAIAAGLLTLSRRQWTVGSADNGSGKTIDLYWGRFLRNVAFDDASYLETSYAMELGLPGVGTAGATEYVYAAGNLVNSTMITSPAQNIVTAKLTFQGTTIGNPTTSRATGASTAAGLLAIDRFTSVSKLKYLRVLNQATEAVVSQDVESWDLTLANNVTPQKQQGTLGAARDIVGKAQIDINMEAFLTQDEGWIACAQNTSLAFGAGFRNADGGIFLDVPSLTWNNAPPKFPGNGAVSLSVKAQAFRDSVGNYSLGVSLFAFLPNG